MNVALVIERIETWRGGAETSTVQFARHLASLGCRVSVVTASHAPSTPDLEIIPIRAAGLSRAIKTWRFMRGASACLRRRRFDIVHSITPCPVADVYQPRGGTIPETLERNLAMRGSTVQRGFKWFTQQANPKQRLLSRYERRLLNRRPSPWVIAISQYVADQLARHYAFDPQRVRLIFNGVDPDQATPAQRREDRTKVRRQLGLAEDDFLVLCVAHNFRLKGVHRAIDALQLHLAAGTGDQHTCLVVVGRDNPSPFVQLAEQRGVAQQVLFAGPSQRIEAFFHAADVLLHPTFYDPCSRVALEAMASGLPVVTTRFNGAAERIVDGRDGYVVDSPDDVQALADRIGRLADRRHRDELAVHAPAAVRDISMRRHAEEVYALYQEVLAR